MIFCQALHFDCMDTAFKSRNRLAAPDQSTGKPCTLPPWVIRFRSQKTSDGTQRAAAVTLRLDYVGRDAIVALGAAAVGRERVAAGA
jgi:hypothetical protein